MTDALPNDDELNGAIDSAFDTDLSSFSDRELLEHIARCLEAIAGALGKMGDALPQTLANPLYRAALNMIIPKAKRK